MSLEAMQAVSAAMAEVVARVGPSVVRVEGRRRPSSGVVFSEGLVVTAAHALEQEEGIELGLEGGKSAPAKLVGHDGATDIALLRVEAGGLLVAPWAEGAPPAVGSLLLAVSRPGRTARAHLGVLSALSEGEFRTPAGGRLERYLESDISLRPGFSGSALCDASGKVVALNTAGLLRGSAAGVTVATLRRVVEQLLAHGNVPRGFLGVSTLPARLPAVLAERLSQQSALLIAGVDPESPAGKAGLLLGDVLAALDGHPLTHPGELVEQLDEKSVGRTVSARIVRAGAVQDVALTIGKREG
jgi:serine protease DegQ